MTREQLLEMKDEERPVRERVEITEVTVDMEGSAELRMEQYLHQIKNPYAFKCGDIAVNICFSEEGRTLEEAVASYLKAVKNVSGR